MFNEDEKFNFEDFNMDKDVGKIERETENEASNNKITAGFGTSDNKLKVALQDVENNEENKVTERDGENNNEN